MTPGRPWRAAALWFVVLAMMVSWGGVAMAIATSPTWGSIGN